jgi:UDP-N-acetylglucosamine acyltransferase
MTNNISQYAHIIGDVRFGNDNFVAPGALIVGPISIGDNNYFGANCVVGTPPQDNQISLESHRLSSWGESKEFNEIIIGNNNVIREFVTIHKGLTTPTIIGDNCYIMSYSHIAHDCKIDNGVKIANSVQMGGYSSIHTGAYLGLSATLHQFSVIGHYAMIGMSSSTRGSIPPLCLAVGSPSRVIQMNKIALEKLGITEFEWTEDYVLNPILGNIHADLARLFREFQEEVDSRKYERLAISERRSSST